MNEGGEVIIDSTIYKIYHSGTTLEIRNLDTTLLANINRWDTIPLDTLNDPNFSFYYKAGQDSTNTACKDYKKKKVKHKVKFAKNVVKTKSGELKSDHYGAGGVTKTLTLEGW